MWLLSGVFISLMVLLLPFPTAAEQRTIASLEKAYNVDSCVSCHGKVHEE